MTGWRSAFLGCYIDPGAIVPEQERGGIIISDKNEAVTDGWNEAVKLGDKRLFSFMVEPGSGEASSRRFVQAALLDLKMARLGRRFLNGGLREVPQKYQGGYGLRRSR